MVGAWATLAALADRWLSGNNPLSDRISTIDDVLKLRGVRSPIYIAAFQHVSGAVGSSDAQADKALGIVAPFQIAGRF